MSDISATEASRNFSDLLDAVEHQGESFTILRRGKVVARLEPAPRGNGWRVLQILRDHPVDPEWADELRALRAEYPVQERDWPE